MVDITADVQTAARAMGLKDGLVTVFCPHTTAALTINENADPDVVVDMVRTFDRLVPRDDGYAHAEGNSDAHIKASLIGFTVQVPWVNGQLRLGTWQGIYFCEFDGPRSRQVWVL